MKINVETTDGYAEKIIVEYTPVEWSLVDKAVKLLRNMSNCKEEVDIFDRMLNTEPELIEVKHSCCCWQDGKCVFGFESCPDNADDCEEYI